jgi:hypothetical protein
LFTESARYRALFFGVGRSVSPNGEVQAKRDLFFRLKWLNFFFQFFRGAKPLATKVLREHENI